MLFHLKMRNIHKISENIYEFVHDDWVVDEFMKISSNIGGEAVRFIYSIGRSGRGYHKIRSRLPGKV